MASPRLERSGLLILKVRVAAREAAEAAPRLAATITTTFDLATRQEEHTTAGSVDEIIAIVRCWLEAFLRGSVGDDAVTKP